MPRFTLCAFQLFLFSAVISHSNPAMAETPPVGCEHPDFTTGFPHCRPQQGELKEHFCCPPEKNAADVSNGTNPDILPQLINEMVKDNLIRMLITLIAIAAVLLLLYLLIHFRQRQSMHPDDDQEKWQQEQMMLAFLAVRKVGQEAYDLSQLPCINPALRERLNKVIQDSHSSLKAMHGFWDNFGLYMKTANAFLRRHGQQTIQTRRSWWDLPPGWSFNPLDWKWIQFLRKRKSSHTKENSSGSMIRRGK